MHPCQEADPAVFSEPAPPAAGDPQPGDPTPGRSLSLAGSRREAGVQGHSRHSHAHSGLGPCPSLGDQIPSGRTASRPYKASCGHSWRSCRALTRPIPHGNQSLARPPRTEAGGKGPDRASVREGGHASLSLGATPSSVLEPPPLAVFPRAVQPGVQAEGW